MRKTWAAPDIEFDKDGRRIRPGKSGPVAHGTCGTTHVSYTPCPVPEEPAATCTMCGGSGKVSLGPGVRGIGRCPRCALSLPGVRS